MFCRIKACGGLLKSGGRFVWYERGDFGSLKGAGRCDSVKFGVCLYR